MNNKDLFCRAVFYYPSSHSTALFNESIDAYIRFNAFCASAAPTYAIDLFYDISIADWKSFNALSFCYDFKNNFPL